MLTSLGVHDVEEHSFRAGIQLRLTKTGQAGAALRGPDCLLSPAQWRRGSRPEPAGDVSPKPARILSRRDNPVNRRVICSSCKRLSRFMAADAVGNGLEALDALERIGYDIVLMDLPDAWKLDGYEAARRNSESRGRIPRGTRRSWR